MKSRITIAHAVNPYLPASMTWVYSQLQALAAGGNYRAMVLTKRRENDKRFPWEDVWALEDQNFLVQTWQRLVKKRFKGYFPGHAHEIKRAGVRLLHSHMGDRGMEDALLARATGVFHITTFYGADIWVHSQNPLWRERFATWAGSVATARDGLFLVEGSAMRARVMELGADPAIVRIFHLGVDLSRIPFEARRPETDGVVRIVMAGRPIEKKGHIYGLQAFAQLARRYPHVHLDLLIGGKHGKSGEITDQLGAIIAAEKLESRVRWDEFLPYDQYLQRLREGHIFLQPSVHAQNGDAEGGFPVTILEMSASGMPIVASDHCDIPEAVLDGKSGWLAPQKDVEGLVRHLSWLLDRPDQWENFGRAGREHVATNYNIERQGRELEAIYDQVLGAARS